MRTLYRIVHEKGHIEFDTLANAQAFRAENADWLGTFRIETVERADPAPPPVDEERAFLDDLKARPQKDWTLDELKRAVAALLR